jgi:predicted nucleic acid-binding protein
MSSASLDTNALVRLLIGDIPIQANKVRKLLHQPLNFHVGDLAIGEFCFVAEKVYQLTRPEIIERLNFILHVPNINCNRVLFSTAITLFSAHPALSFVDCCLAIQAELNNALPLYTFDKKLANQSGGLAKLIG